MRLSPSRRGLILGAAGASLATAACSHQRSAHLAEDIGAFPHMPGERPEGMDGLVSPKKGVARLSSNENPYGPAKSALKMMDYATRKGAYYPITATQTLKDMIAERNGLTPDHISLSTGSAEALSAIAMIYGQEGPILAPRLFFDATPLYAKRLGLAEIERVALAPNMDVDLSAIEARVTERIGAVQLCNPNNPTGILTPAAVLKPAVKRMAKKTMVVVDEAYIELTDNPEQDSCVDLVRQGHNVIVSRTFSKLYGMAGIRVGYVMGPPEAIQKINGAKMSWMSGVGLAGAIGCYNDTGFMRDSLSKIREGREMIEATLDNLDLERLPSQTNFVYFRSGRDADSVQKEFAAQNISIRGTYMDYTDWSRVSTGRLQDVARFCKALPEIVRA